MPEPGTLALFTVAAVGLLLIPGPAVLYIITRSLVTLGVTTALAGSRSSSQ
jgi:threonine/homoserine/homoserine lactone efflux protein